ncbi:hypothetical protein IW00_03985, partial [Pectobacterium brasiliense]
VGLFYQCLEPIAHRIGQLWLQLPATFGPAQLPVLWRFLDTLPQGFSYGVEVRHPLFFAKGDEERALNQGFASVLVNSNDTETGYINTDCYLFWALACFIVFAY